MRKKMTLYCSILALVILIQIPAVHAQSPLTVADAKTLVEKLVLATDRDMYCTDEHILISAFNTSSEQMRKSSWSHVLYVELIDPNGKPIAQKKMTFGSNGAAGQLQIPAWVLTGNYFLRAYTRWMRNYSQSGFACKVVKIINPQRVELLENLTAQTTDTAGVLKSVQADSTIRIKTERKVYSRRELINMELSANQDVKSGEKLVVSVVPKGLEAGKEFRMKIKTESFTSEYIPETRGVSISGKIVNKSDSLPIASTLVGLTVFDESRENLNILTNEKSRFFFDLNHRKGETELFVSTKPISEDVNPLILVDNDFSSQKVKLPFIPLDLSRKSRSLYQSLVLNSQITALYREKADTVRPVSQKTSIQSFYGDPEFVLYLKDYIEMPTVRDYFFELIYQARVKQEGKRQVIKMVNKLGQLEEYDPLIMMDMVAVFDLDQILELKPDKLERIEIIPKPFIRGNITYSGIISFFSKKQDLAGIDLPSTGRFINYSMLSDNSAAAARLSENPKIPDLRNCLYWNPSLEIKSGETTKIAFQAGDTSGEFLIVIQSVDKMGNLSVTASEIQIK